jgi:ADP-ribose pyrophosphatase YjhB (NUDIX family)
MALFSWHGGEVLDGMQIKQVYGLIFSKDGRLLLRVETDGGKTEYSLAGGHPEQNDDGIEGTLRRELKEEVNVEITKPILVGYQEVCEGGGSPAFAQVRMTALIDSVGELRPDTDNGKTYGRLLAPPLKAAELLKWGEVGYLQIREAMNVAVKSFGIEFTDRIGLTII